MFTENVPRPVDLFMNDNRVEDMPDIFFTTLGMNIRGDNTFNFNGNTFKNLTVDRMFFPMGKDWNRFVSHDTWIEDCTPREVGL